MEAIYQKYKTISGLWDFGMKIIGLKRGLARFVSRLPVDIPARARIFEVGCGTGAITIPFAKRFPNARILATDINHAMLKEAKKFAVREGIAAPRISFGYADVNNPTVVRTFPGKAEERLLGGSFDIVVASAVLEHADMARAIPRLVSLVKPGGYFISIAMNQNMIGKLYGKIYDFELIPYEKIRSHLVRSGVRDITRLPFLTKEFPANFYRDGIVARI